MNIGGQWPPGSSSELLMEFVEKSVHISKAHGLSPGVVNSLDPSQRVTGVETRSRETMELMKV